MQTLYARAEAVPRGPPPASPRLVHPLPQTAREGVYTSNSLSCAWRLPGALQAVENSG
jgi:hypothetical protein